MSCQIPQSVAGTNKLLDHLSECGHLKNDAALARHLEVAPPVISKMRHGHLNLGPALLLKIHELFEIPVADIKSLLTQAEDAVAA